MNVMHRVWRALPRGMRREALFSATTLLAPRPTRPAPSGEGSLIVAGYFGAQTGLGAAVRRHVIGLRQAGFDPIEADLTGPLRQGARGPAPHVSPGPGTLLVHVNGPMLPWALLVLGRAAVAGKRVAAVWNWELPVLPRDWDRGYRFAHSIWVASCFTAAAIERPGGPPVQLAPYPVPPPQPAPVGRAEFGLPEDAFVALCVFDATSSLARKNPLAAIGAHRLAFGDRTDRLLVLKTHSTEAAGQAWHEVAREVARSPNVRVLDAVMDRRRLWALMAASDVLVSLHRSEGFGFAIAEAMRLGKPVVATGWSGNMDFMRGRPGAHAVPFTLVPVRDSQATYEVPGARWADPDIAAASGTLRQLADDPASRAAARPVEFAGADYARLLGLTPSASRGCKRNRLRDG